MTDFFSKYTSFDGEASVAVAAQERMFPDIKQRIMVSHNVGLSKFTAHLTMQQAEELADALCDALEWVRAIPHRKAEAEEQERREAADDTERPSISNPGEYDLPSFITREAI